MTTIQNLFLTVRAFLLCSCMILLTSHLLAQASQTKRQLLVDVVHGQKFYNDPADMPGKDPALVDRIKYMSEELKKMQMHSMPKLVI